MIEIRKTDDGEVRIKIINNTIVSAPDGNGVIIEVLGDWSPEELVITGNSFIREDSQEVEQAAGDGKDYSETLRRLVRHKDVVRLPKTGGGYPA